MVDAVTCISVTTKVREFFIYHPNLIPPGRDEHPRQTNEILAATSFAEIKTVVPLGDATHGCLLKLTRHRRSTNRAGDMSLRFTAFDVKIAKEQEQAMRNTACTRNGNSYSCLGPRASRFTSLHSIIVPRASDSGARLVSRVFMYSSSWATFSYVSARIRKGLLVLVSVVLGHCFWPAHTCVCDMERELFSRSARGRAGGLQRSAL